MNKRLKKTLKLLSFSSVEAIQKVVHHISGWKRKSYWEPLVDNCIILEQEHFLSHHCLWLFWPPHQKSLMCCKVPSLSLSPFLPSALSILGCLQELRLCSITPKLEHLGIAFVVFGGSHHYHIQVVLGCSAPLEYLGGFTSTMSSIVDQLVMSQMAVIPWL